MGKLIKYEFRKQLMSKLVVGFVVLALQLLLCAGMIVDNADLGALGMGGTIIVAVVSLIYFGFESIVTYSSDLKTKHSYMLFLTPRNMFQIVGAKFVTSILQIFVFGCAFAAIGIGDVFILCAKNRNVKAFLGAVKDFFQLFTGVEIRLIELIYCLVLLLISMLVIVAMAMFAITLSATLLSNWKYKGVVSVIIFFALDWCLARVANWVTPTEFLEREYLVVNTEAWAFAGVYVAALVLCYVGTALMLDKKVSV